MKKLSIAIVGCGAIFRNNHLPALTNLPVWDIKYLVDTDINNIKTLAEELNCDVLDDIKEIPSYVDACLIATPNYLHKSQTIELLERGHHVITEKPVGLSLNETIEISKSIKKHGKEFFIVHQKRFNTNVQLLKDKLNIDEIQAIEISLGNKFAWKSKTNFYLDSQKAGGGVFIDLGVHLLDILVFFGIEFTINHFHSSNKSIENAVTCIGNLNNGGNINLYVSRISDLDNKMIVKTYNTTYIISLDNQNYFAEKRLNAKLFEFHLQDDNDPFKKYWKAVAEKITFITKSDLSEINSGIEVMKFIDQYNLISKHEN
jgi:predicted dehydrogenase